MNLTDFTTAELTAAINQFPVQWGEIGKRGIFADRGIRTREIVIEDREGALAVLNTHDWGGEGTVASPIARNTYAFSIKQTTHEDIVSAADVQDIRAFGVDAGVNGLQSIESEVALRLQRMRAKHDITLEYKRMGALKGNVLNADGSSSLANMFTTFGVTQLTVDFVLGTATTKILDKCAEVRNQIEDNLGGDSMTGIDVAVSPVSIHARHCWRANQRETTHAPLCDRFNPRPPLLAGESHVPTTYHLLSFVSIHARHCWRANRKS